MEIKFQPKLTDQNLDALISIIFKRFNEIPNDFYRFDLTELEHIGNQELLVLSAIFKLFYTSNIKFEVIFFKKGIPTTSINRRTKKQIIQIWEVWKIWKVVEDQDYIKYFGIDGQSIRRLKKELDGYSPMDSEIYNRHGVTPFIALDYINNYNQNDIQEIINPIYQLNSAIAELLKKDNCYHPFTSQVLSAIITEEFYLNFLDHSNMSSFRSLTNMAFMSISFQRKITETSDNSDWIQQIKKTNFQTEILPEAKSFYFDESRNKFKNISYIEFSFLDFGSGIVNTLKNYYPMTASHNNITDSEILKFSFEYFSSRHSINPQLEKDIFIPRGLFDCLTIVKRYQGLLVVRSNKGKILYDFSDPIAIKDGVTFSDEKLYFPGTLVSIYLPAIEGIFSTSAIKPDIKFNFVKPENKRYLNFTTILTELPLNKSEIYNVLFKSLRKKITSNNQATLTFFGFEGAKFAERRILKKTLYFLISDYAINNLNNVIVMNFPKEDLLDEIENEIINLNPAYQSHKLHPLPIVTYNSINEHINIRWLGVFNDKDKDKLNELLFEEYSIAFTDFQNPNKVTGQLNAFDNYGNLNSNFPSQGQIISFYDEQRNELYKDQLFELLSKHKCIENGKADVLYLTNANFYQEQYIELTYLVNDKNDCAIVAKMLFENLKKNLPRDKYRYIAVTTSSQKILESLENQQLINEDDYIFLENYHTFENDSNIQSINTEYKYILICDVIATGALTLRLNAKLNEMGTCISYVGVLISTLSPGLLSTDLLMKEFHNKIFFLYKYKIPKYRKAFFGDGILNKKIIRINPYTNRPIDLSISETNFNESIVFHSSSSYNKSKNSIHLSNPFLDHISVDDIKLGFKKYNNLIYPYYFEIKNIIKNISEISIKTILKNFKDLTINKNHIQVFSPRKSGVEGLDINKLKRVLKNHSIEEFKIDRYSTLEGWIFPQNTSRLIHKVENNTCLILDDGSCSGDSMIQMIDEIAFYNTKEIIILCFIGRVNDHKREFFSRLTHIKSRDLSVIPISIHFVSHWHIPTYDINANPNTKESVWLEEIINLANTPQSIKNLAQKVLDAITPKMGSRYQDYKYLPKIRSDDILKRVVPKKEILLVREELGKVIGYRLYKESFTFFEAFFKKYETKLDTKDRYKEIELLCATFIFEPYLYDRIVGLMPDIIEQIESFVKVLLFSNIKIYKKLTYRWNKKDIVHLFFIVFKNEKLIDILKITSNFEALLKFTGPLDPVLNYVLYKLLFYFPIKPQYFPEKKFDNKFKKLISEIKDKPEFRNREIIKFYNFILSLPSRNDFHSQIESLKETYISQNDRFYHEKKISFNHNISLAITTIRNIRHLIESGSVIDDEKVTLVKGSWFEILNFVNPILSFSSSFKEFLFPFPYLRQFNILEGENNSLRQIVGYNDDVILSLVNNFSDHEKLKTVERNISKMQNDIGINSTMYNLIVYGTSNLKQFLVKFKNGLVEIFPNVTLDLSFIDDDWLINIPQLYVDNLIAKELLININNYSDKTAPLNIEISFLELSILELIIKNRILEKEASRSTGEGIKCLTLLAAFSPFGFTYELLPPSNNFIQKITFKFVK